MEGLERLPSVDRNSARRSIWANSPEYSEARDFSFPSGHATFFMALGVAIFLSHKKMGYLFYIETMDKKPGLFLMRHTSYGHAETIAKIEEIPHDLITGAIAENAEKEYGGMYPINKKIEEWLKKEFGIR